MMRTLPLIAVILLGSVAAAEEPGSRQTREFVNAAAQSDQFEIWEARVALTTSDDPHVRAFAQHMIDAHTQTTTELEQAASQAGLQPPAESMSNDQALLLGSLQGLSPADFEKAYWSHQATAHRGALAVEQAYANDGDIAPIRRVAAAAVPMISEHLQMAEQMKNGLSQTKGTAR